MPKVNVSISVDDAYVERISTVVERLQAMGMEVDQVLPGMAVISGSVEANDVNHLYEIEGVQHIESEQSYQLPSPDSDVQ
jgi:hypothetical protein